MLWSGWEMRERERERDQGRVVGGGGMGRVEQYYRGRALQSKPIYTRYPGSN